LAIPKEFEDRCGMNELWTQALQLPEQERAALARQLLLSLEPDDFGGRHEAAWEKELEARMAAIDEGRFAARDWREALADIRKSLTEESAP
jgi:putative addiction module component (TIGR02574 family)